MKNGYKKTLLLLLLLLVVTSITGISYAFYEKDVTEKNNLSLVLTNEKLSVNYLDGKEYDLKEVKSGDTYNKRVSITNVSNESTYVTVSLMDVEKPSDSSMSLVLLDSNKKEVYNEEITNVDTEVVKTVELDAGKTISYTFMIENNGSDIVNNFFANILVYTESVKADVKSIKSTILSNNEIKSATTNVGQEVSNGNEGLIKTVDDDGEAYYFRGNVTNNYVNFGGFTWKITRINGDGTVRLILDGSLDDSSTYSSNTNVVDDYTTKMNFDGSDAKSKLNSWLTSNLSEVSNYIVNSSFCEDNNIYKEENNVQYLNPYKRVYDEKSVSLLCNGTIVKNQVGLLNIDEVEMAGAFQDKENTNYYLYNENIKNGWWTLSGSQILIDNNVVDGFVVLNNGSISYDKKINTQFALRPVVSLDKNTIVTGDGTANNPYVVKVS